MRLMSSVVAASPAITAAGSPGRQIEQREDDERDHRHDDEGREEPPDYIRSPRSGAHRGTMDLPRLDARDDDQAVRIVISSRRSRGARWAR